MSSDTKQLDPEYYGSGVNNCGNYIRGFENLPIKLKKKEEKDED